MIPNPWVIVGAMLFWLISMAGAYMKGADHEAAKWQAEIAKIKNDAANVLIVETNKVRDLEKRLQDKANEVEKNHVAATQEIAAASAKYARLGKLYESVKGCRGGSGSANGSTASATTVDHGGEGSREVVSGPDDGDSIEAVTRDADLMRVTVQACQQYLRDLPGLLR
jgi:hypothetical protein